MDWMHSLIFASDAKLVLLGSTPFLLVAIMATFAERRRIRRARIDRVGWVPWTGVFLTCSVIGATMAALGVTGMLKG